MGELCTKSGAPKIKGIYGRWLDSKWNAKPAWTHGIFGWCLLTDDSYGRGDSQNRESSLHEGLGARGGQWDVHWGSPVEPRWVDTDVKGHRTSGTKPADLTLGPEPCTMKDMFSGSAPPILPKGLTIQLHSGECNKISDSLVWWKIIIILLILVLIHNELQKAKALFSSSMPSQKMFSK